MAPVPANESRKAPPGQSVLLEPIERLCRFVTCATGEIAQKLAATEVELSQIATAIRLLRELTTFAAPPGPELPRRELEAGVAALAKFVTPEEAKRAYYVAGEYGRGRPIVRRHVVAAALEMKENNPHLSRVELAQRFCPCGKTTHDSKCAQRLRRDIQRLKALIRKILAEYPA